MKRVLLIAYLSILLVLYPEQALAIVRISNMNDFSFGSWGGTGSLQSSDAVCIYNSASTIYTIRATGDGSGGAFTLASGANTLAYTVEFRGSIGGFVALTPGSGRSFRAANTSSSTCLGSTNATIRVTITEADLLAARSGSYSGVLTILLSP